jgi:hypothetical protein
MSDEDDLPHRSHRWGDMHEGADPSGGMPAVEQPAARWASLQSDLLPGEVRRRLVERLAGGTNGGFKLTETKSGLLVRWVRRKKVLVAELSLVAWEAGTQIHVTVPTATGAKRKELDELRHHLETALG